ncbi:ABC transporter permease, partial [Pseudomonas syringae pv. pisi]
NLTAPWLALSGFFSLAVVLSLLIYVGEATRDAFDPRRQ